MATEIFVHRQSRVVVKYFELNHNSSEEEILQAIKEAKGLRPKFDVVAIDYSGEEYVHKAGKAIFPETVYIPEENAIGTR